MSDSLQSLLNIVGDPDRPDLESIRAPMLARIAEIEPEQRKRLYDECFAAWRSISREDSKRYYSHFIVFQCLSKATKKPVPLDEEQQAVMDRIMRSLAENNGDWYEKQTWLTPEEVAENIKRRNAEYLQR
jgi:hypothetical protein